MKFKKLLVLVGDDTRFGFFDDKDRLYHCVAKKEIETAHSHLLGRKVAHLKVDFWVCADGAVGPEGAKGLENSAPGLKSYINCLSVTFKG